MSVCRHATRLVRDPEIVLAEAREMLQDQLDESCCAVLAFDDRDKKVVRDCYISTANRLYQHFIATGQLQVGDEDDAIDSYRHYDPVCLIHRLVKFRIRLHQFLLDHCEGGFDDDTDVDDVLELVSAEFLDAEAKLLAHHCISQSNLPKEIPCHRNPFRRFDTFLFSEDPQLKSHAVTPFTTVPAQYSRILYDFSYPKCQLVETLTGKGYNMAEGEVVTNKLIAILILDDIMTVRCQHFRFIAETGPYNVKDLEAGILKEIQRHNCGGTGLGAIYDAIKLSRHNLQLIKGEIIDLDDGEVIVVNHVHYMNHWRVLIHDTKLDLADKKLCQWCYTKAGKSCHGCKVGLYCSRECQSIHWSMHRFYCKGSEEIYARSRQGIDPYTHFASDGVL